MLRNFRAHGRTLVAGVLLGVAAASLVSWLAVPAYTSSAQLFVNVSRTTDSASAYEGNLFSQQRVASYAQILSSTQLAQKVVDELGLPLSPEEVAAAVTVTPVPNTVVLDVRVTDTSPLRAQAIGASLTRQFTDQVTSLETSPGSAVSTVRIDTIQGASFDPTPVSPDVFGNLWRGGAVGLLLAAMVVLVRSRFDTSVRDGDDVLDAAGVQVISRVTDDLPISGRHPLTDAAARSRAAAGTRSLATFIRHANPDRPPRVITVTSALPGEGKSTVAVGLAVALVQAGHTVAVVDTNVHRPRVAKYLGLADGSGLTDVLNGSAELSQVVERWQGTGLSVLRAGSPPRDANELLGSGQMRAVLKTLRDTHDYIVIDAPPVLPVAEAAVLAALADGAVFVCRHGRTQRGQLDRGVTAVRLLSGTVLGVVLTRVPQGALPALRRGYRPDRTRRSAAGASEPDRASVAPAPAETALSATAGNRDGTDAPERERTNPNR